MKKNGYTLVELLATIIILGALCAITLVSVSGILKNSKNNLSNVQKERIEKIAEIYYLKEGMNSGATCINISDLVDKGYVESKEVLDPKTREVLPGSVKIEDTSTKISYTYQENACS